MRLRPYKPCDGDTVASWLTDEKIHAMWSVGRYAFPMTGQQINERLDAGRDNPCEFMFTALDDDGMPVGYFLLRNADWEAQSVHIGFIVIDSRRRGKGFGKQMLTLAKKYCFEILGMKRITLGVFHINPRAIECYESSGFVACGTEDETFTFNGREWKVIEMECVSPDE